MKLLKIIDQYLNNITMYSLMLYGLTVLLASSIILSLVGRLSLPASGIIASSAVILSVCFIADRLLPIIFNTVANKYSSLITALILCLILPPTTSLHRLALAGLGGLISITSKYIIALHHKHIFNPAALAAIILGLSGLLPAIWWIGTPVMLPLTIIFGLLILRKVRRFRLFGIFLLASLLVAILVGLHDGQTIHYILTTAFRSSPLIFLGSVMLTEPSTSPPRLKQQLIYGFIVGAIFTSEVRIGSVSATPELALIIGNIYAYIVSPKYSLRLRLIKRERLAPQIYDFSFSGAEQLNFRPGQYLEWTLPATHSDSRGNRRLFSISSAKNDSEIHFATRFYEHGSSYKKELMSLNKGDLIVAGQLGGDFVLTDKDKQKLVFIAGSIGITPFVSIVKTMIKEKQKRKIVLFYLVSKPEDLCYEEVWKQAAGLGVKVVPILSKDNAGTNWKHRTGYLTDNVLRKEVPDYMEAYYYISGPPGLVDNYTKLLTGMKIKYRQIKRDHFSGY